MDVLSLRAAGFLAAAVAALALPLPRNARLAILCIANLAFLYLLHPLTPAIFLVVTAAAFAGAHVAVRLDSKWLFVLISAAVASLLFLPKTGLFGGAAADEGATGFAASFSKSPACFAGASYFTLRALQFMFDARREGSVHFTILETVAWNGFFPTILAGPIERSQHFAESIEQVGRPGFDDVLDGGKLLFTGLLKKVVLSQMALVYAGPLLEFPAKLPTHTEVWTSLYAFGLYFYFDFAGYSDLATGAGRFCGIKLADNFNNPFWKPNIAEFWRAWHISLSSWIRDYVFLPLCGRSSSALRLHMASVVSMVLCGLWHGLTPGWAVWGVFHGAALSIHQSWTGFLRKRFKLKQKLAKSRTARIAAIIITFHFLALAWTFTAFATDSLRLPLRFVGLALGL